MPVAALIPGQPGNRVCNALRAFPPGNAREVKGAAGTLRPDPATVMTQLQIGEGSYPGHPRVARRKTVIFPAPEKSSAVHYDAPKSSAPPLVASPDYDCAGLPVRNRRENFPFSSCRGITMHPPWGQGWRKGGVIT